MTRKRLGALVNQIAPKHRGGSSAHNIREVYGVTAESASTPGYNGAGAGGLNAGAGPNRLSQVLGQSGAGEGSLPDGMTKLRQQIDQLSSVSKTQTDNIATNTLAVQQNTSSQGKGSSTAGALTSHILGGVLSAFPLASLFSGLFGGGSKTPAPLTQYAAPSSISFEGAYPAGSSGSLPASYDQYGRPRAIGKNSGAQPAQAPANITVQVNAMDSKSFMDHSNDIANAVKSAMLNLHSLNDVVNDL